MYADYVPCGSLGCAREWLGRAVSLVFTEVRRFEFESRPRLAVCAVVGRVIHAERENTVMYVAHVLTPTGTEPLPGLLQYTCADRIVRVGFDVLALPFSSPLLVRVDEVLTAVDEAAWLPGVEAVPFETRCAALATAREAQEALQSVFQIRD